MSDKCPSAGTSACDTCGEDCPSRTNSGKNPFAAELNELSSVKKVIGVVSGKGGVGKSSITALLATLMQRKGYRTAVMDADLTGPSIPRIFGLHDQIHSPDGVSLYPCKTKNGIDVVSINLMLPDEEQPVIWRGPVISGVIKQFWSDVVWADIDIMFIDMPPGTGDVSLTVFQSIPLDGIILVTTPQDLVSMIVKKSMNMAKMMNIPIIGIIENMSYVTCPVCGKRIDLFGSKADAEKEYGLPLLAELPMNPEIPQMADTGAIDEFQEDYLDKAVEVIENYSRNK